MVFFLIFQMEKGGGGEVVGAKIVRGQETKRSKGFGFVEMTNKDKGLWAIKTLNGQERA
ncbi:MAG: hypothetical protein Q8K70_03645 [Bacteroidota bacterium]|nr:hypothetical protein [Bacteroidota bacterium]